MTPEKAKQMIDRLVASSQKLTFGDVAISAKIHEGRIVSIAISVTESVKEFEERKLMGAASNV